MAVFPYLGKRKRQDIVAPEMQVKRTESRNKLAQMTLLAMIYGVGRNRSQRSVRWATEQTNRIIYTNV